jgi:hypothetical protein
MNNCQSSTVTLLQVPSTMVCVRGRPRTAVQDKHVIDRTRHPSSESCGHVMTRHTAGDRRDMAVLPET